ncbi:LiaI-LiaF-like domain-containing protein [Mucilaginibacter litoreus]|uniref:LiaI-LiaF-like domain-containing protein n=1 Tax=Mucilaginibacter litoreus TaxID=1048221 RepID=A0ABW3AQA8_9SPHI
MRSEKLVPGLILVAIGVIFLLDNYNVINFHWSNLWHLWPIFLIMVGVNLVFANNKSAWATALKIGVVILGFGLLIFGHFENRWFSPFDRHWRLSDDGWHRHDNDNDFDNDDDDNDSDTSRSITKVQGSSTYSEPLKPGITEAKLNVYGGGTLYTLKDTSAQLFEATTKEYFNRFLYTNTMEGNIPVLELRMKDKKGHIQWDSDNTNSADIKLSTKPVWNINIKAGATKVDFDLSRYRVRNLTLNGGAGSFEIKMGMPVSATRVEVSTGVSEVDIKVPQGAACQIVSNSGLSSDNFQGFTKTNGGNYETPGFNSATNKIYIIMKGGLSDFKVSRY